MIRPQTDTRPLIRVAYIGRNGHGGFRMAHDDRPGHFRSWCVCECGWASPDIIGREGAIIVWNRHIQESGDA